jgi:hypothetical protein
MRLGWPQLFSWVFWIRDIFTYARNRNKNPLFSSPPAHIPVTIPTRRSTNKAVYYWNASAFSHCVYKLYLAPFNTAAKVSGNVANTLLSTAVNVLVSTSVATAFNASSLYIRYYGSEYT